MKRRMHSRGAKAMTAEDKTHGVTQVSLTTGQTVCLAQEVPVALTFNGTTQAVMMASPLDLEDFMIGFSVTEGYIADPCEIETLEIIEHPDGFEARAWLSDPSSQRFTMRRRASLGPVGCGLCGIDSIEQAMRSVPAVKADLSPILTAESAAQALSAMQPMQVLHAASRATHAAGFWVEGKGIVCLREDVGRHNALDKLAGALIRQNTDAATGAIVMTSRLSVDLIQKAAIMGSPIIIAPSAPTSLAVKQAERAGITLIAREKNGPGVYTHPGRIKAQS